MKVCYSGTFNILHKGHKKLIDNGIEIAGKNGTLYIGVTEGKIIKNKKIVVPFDKRVKKIKEYLKLKKYEQRIVIKKIYDEYGPAINGDYDAIIVSPESIKNAERLNIKRMGNNRKPLKIIELPFVLADDNKPISSTRIYNKEIDEEGKILK